MPLPHGAIRRLPGGQLSDTDARLFALVEDDELSWQERALCAQTDPESFYPDKGGSTREAKSICKSCDVRDECLQYALDHDERFGIWGGLSERERRKLKPSVKRKTGPKPASHYGAA